MQSRRRHDNGYDFIPRVNTTTSTRPANGSNGTQGVAIRELNAYVKQEAGFIPALLAEINKVMVGQEALVERVLIALLADGHVLWRACPAWLRRC